MILAISAGILLVAVCLLALVFVTAGKLEDEARERQMWAEYVRRKQGERR